MNEIRTLPVIFTTVIIMPLMALSALTPWQLFQSMCPYFSAQSPQCAMLQQQQQQQQPLAPQQQSASAVLPPPSLPSTSSQTISPSIANTPQP